MTRARTAVARAAPAEVLEPASGGDVLAAPVLLGQGESGDPIGLDVERLVDGRLLIQGMSGAGKSWLLRRLLETTADRIQQVVIDPEGEFGSLAARYGHVAVDAERLDAVALEQAAARARRHRLSLWVDLSQLDRGPQMAAVAAVLGALVKAPPDEWHPVLVAVDEVHLFAPQGGSQGAASHLRRRSLDAVADLMSRGRKRGLCGVLATQRLVKLAKSVASEAGNVLVGRNVLELDIGRAAEAIGWPDRKAQDLLPKLAPGTFVAVGPAFTRSPVVVAVGPVQTRHGGSTPRLGAPPPRRDDPAGLIDLADLAAESDVRAAALRSGVDPRDVTAVRDFARRPHAAVALRIVELLRGLGSLPVLIAQLPVRFGVGAAAVEEAVSLLEDFGLARTGMADSGRTVRAP